MSIISPLGNIDGKQWGATWKCFQIPGICEVWAMIINPHSYCSKHRHTFKFNQFVVLSGNLLVRTWKNDYPCIDETTIHPKGSMLVKPKEYHRFINNTDEVAIAIEIYWCELGSDIEREDHG